MQYPGIRALLRVLTILILVLAASWALATKQQSEYSDGFFIVSVFALHVLSAWLGLRQPHQAARVAVVNWAWKVAYGLYMSLSQHSGPQGWQLLFSSSGIYPLGIASACLDFYQMHSLHPLLVAAMATCQAFAMSTCITKFKQQMQMPSPGWLNTSLGLLAGMVAGPLLAGALLPHRHVGNPGGLHPQQLADADQQQQQQQQQALPQPLLPLGSIPERPTPTVGPGRPGLQRSASGLQRSASAPASTSAAAAAAESSSAEELRWLQHARSNPYTSGLPGKAKVCFKLQTGALVSDVPRDLAVQLQTALSTGGYPQHHLVDVAVRPGCLVISLDLVELPATIAATATVPAALPESLPAPLPAPPEAEKPRPTTSHDAQVLYAVLHLPASLTLCAVMFHIAPFMTGMAKAALISGFLLCSVAPRLAVDVRTRLVGHPVLRAFITQYARSSHAG